MVVDTAALRAMRWFVAACATVVLLLAPAWASEAGVVGGAALQPPTSPRFGTWGWYDLVDVDWSGATAEGVGELRVGLAAVDDLGPGGLGLRQPVIEVYLLGGARSETLPGTNLSFPAGTGWSRAVRISGEGVWAYAEAGGVEQLDAAVEGATVRIAWPHPLPAGARFVAISGVFDPFSDHGWRPFSREPSPWAFASATTGPPVVDVWPSGAGAWARLESGVVPISTRRFQIRGGRGLAVASMLLGVVVAVAGLALRNRVGRLSGDRRRRSGSRNRRAVRRG